MLNPRFQQAMTAFQPSWSQESEQNELPPDAFTCQLENALDVLEREGGPPPDGDDGRTLEEMIQQLGLAEGMTDQHRTAVQAAPQMIERLVDEIEQGLSR